jgi:hypothetical protein
MTAHQAGIYSVRPRQYRLALTALSRVKGSSKGRHLDYGVLREENRCRGTQGEKHVADYERAWLRQDGRHDLASRVQWTDRDSGDGLVLQPDFVTRRA